MSDKDKDRMEKIVSLCKRRGFVFQGSEIYGGLRGTWDYGPLGVALNNRIKQEWRKHFVDSREDMYGLDSAILMNAKVWEASGHTGAGFADAMIKCITCQAQFRIDHLIQSKESFKNFQKELAEAISGTAKPSDSELEYIDILLKLYEYFRGSEPFKKVKEDKEVAALIREGLTLAEKYLGVVTQLYLAESQKCPNCGADGGDAWGMPQPGMTEEECKKISPRDFNMMFETRIGSLADTDNKVYLRPETAQGIFVNFKNIIDSMAPKMPFGIAQIGKAFRNEIAPREWLFRVREFEQMEIEYFVRETEWETEFEKLRTDIQAWHTHLGLSSDNIREYEVPENDLAHYSKRTIDFEYNYPGKGFDELAGFAYRTDHDLKSHQEASGVSMEYIEPDGSRFIPHVLEPSFGVGRAFMAVLCEAYTEDEMGGETRIYLKLPIHLAPYRVAVSPLLKNKPQLVEKAHEVFTMLKAEFGNVAWDDNGNVGKRYRRQDEIGTPHCVVIDFDTLGEEDPAHKDTVTVRDRDTGEQTRVKIEDLVAYLR